MKTEALLARCVFGKQFLGSVANGVGPGWISVFLEEVVSQEEGEGSLERPCYCSKNKRLKWNQDNVGPLKNVLQIT